MHGGVHGQKGKQEVRSWVRSEEFQKGGQQCAHFEVLLTVISFKVLFIE